MDSAQKPNTDHFYALPEFKGVYEDKRRTGVVQQQKAGQLRVEEGKKKGEAMKSVGRSGHSHEELASQGGNKLVKVAY